MTIRLRIQKFILIFAFAVALPALARDDIDAGPLFSEFPLTLTPGHRREAAGPLFYSQQSESQKQWALPPLFCYTRTPDVDWTEMEFLYPIITYRRFGGEYRLSIVEFFSFYGGQSSPENRERQFTLFPFYFQQRGPDTNQNYTALLPFYGTLQNRLFRDNIKFILFPLYSETRKKDVVTENYLYPIFDRRRGDHMTGWQAWPVVGVEHKTPSVRTNMLDEAEIVTGYDKYFAAWPFYFKSRSGLGTTNQGKSVTVVPFYSHTQAPARDEKSYGWPLGYNVIHDREKKYVEHDFLWPLFVKARGEKTITRVFPFYSRAHNPDLESDFYLWPVYKFNTLKTPSLERQRTRILFFLYSDIKETNTQSFDRVRRTDFWPFYSYHLDMDGNQRWQAFALFEPFFPNNRSVPREYSQIWSVWRCEKNHKTGASSQSLLGNFYRREETPRSKNFSLFFGLYQYQSGAEGRRWRICHVTVAKKPGRAAAPEL